MADGTAGPLDEQRDAAPLVAAARVLRERWPVIVLMVVICTGAAVAFSLSSTKQYDASASLLFRQSDLTSLIDPTGAANRNNDAQRDQGTNLLLVKSGVVARRVKNQLRLPESPEDLLAQVTVTAEPDADILHVTAEDPDPVKAARL